MAHIWSCSSAALAPVEAAWYCRCAGVAQPTTNAARAAAITTCNGLICFFPFSNLATTEVDLPRPSAAKNCSSVVSIRSLAMLLGVSLIIHAKELITPSMRHSDALVRVLATRLQVD